MPEQQPTESSASRCPLSACCGMKCPESGYDLITWKQKPCTAIVFGTGLAIYSAMYVFGYSAVLLAIRILQLNLFAAAAGKLTGHGCTMTQDNLKSKVTCLLNMIEVSLHNLITPCVVSVLTAENLVETAKAFAAVTVVGIVSGWFCTSTLFLLAWIGAFTGPFIYHEKKDVIQPLLKQLQGMVQQQVGKASTMVPSAQQMKKKN